MYQTIGQFLTNNGYIDSNYQSFKVQFVNHPDYPSFKSLVDTFNYFEIKNIALSVPKDKLLKLPRKFLTTIEINGNEELVSVNRINKKVLNVHKEDKLTTYTVEEFKSIWTAKVIAIEPLHFLKRKQSGIGIAVLVSLLITFTTGLFINFSFPAIVALAVTMFGIGISILTLNEEIGLTNPDVKKFCNAISKSNCSKVIKSSSAKIFGVMSFSEASFAFYASVGFFIAFIGYKPVLLIPAIVGLAIVLYSLYIQLRKLKTICPLCLITSLLTIIFSLTTLTTQNFTIIPKDLMSLLALLLLFSILSIYGKRLLQGYLGLQSQNRFFIELKREENFIKLSYRESKNITRDEIFHHDIILGPVNAEKRIISLTNPFCNYCREAFLSYIQILKNPNIEVQIVIRFLIRSENLHSDQGIIANRLKQIFHVEGADKFILAYSEWLENKDTEGWKKKYGTLNDGDFSQDLEHDLNWAESEKINYTPATIVNSKHYPPFYNYNDLAPYVQHL